MPESGLERSQDNVSATTLVKEGGSVTKGP